MKNTWITLVHIVTKITIQSRYTVFFDFKLEIYYVFVCSSDLLAHINKHSKITVDDKCMWRCDICTKTLETLSQFKVHRKSHPKPFKCSRCNTPFKFLSKLRRHCLQSIKCKDVHKFGIKIFDSFECSYCGRIFTTKIDLRNHMLFMHFRPALPPKTNYICDICGHNFNSINMLDSHRCLHNIKTYVNKSKNCPNIKPVREKHLIYGQKQWNQMDNTVCQKCDKTFETPEGLDAHCHSFVCYSSKKRKHKCDVSVFKWLTKYSI